MSAEDDDKRVKKFTALLRQDQIKALEVAAAEEDRSKTFLLRQALDMWIEQRRKARKA